MPPNSNLAETETYQLTMPSVVLAGPEDDKLISVTDMNGSKYYRGSILHAGWHFT